MWRLRTLLTFSPLLIFILAACETPRTETLVFVDGEPKVRELATAVRLRVFDEEQELVFDTLAPVGDGEEPDWALSLALVPEDVTQSRLVEAMAIRGSVTSDPLVTVRARIGFVKEETRSVSLVMDDSCIGVDCDADESCRNARCVDIEELDGSEWEGSYQCIDEQTNGDESDTDCGGSCAGCDEGDNCERNADCASGFCDDDECVAAACDDGKTNGDETDEDCGGSDCAPCEEGRHCGEDSDCETSLCVEGECTASGIELPSCDDDTLNNNETDVDCGQVNGADDNECERCGVGKHCDNDDDCESGFCDPESVDGDGLGHCAVPSEACSNGMRDERETDADCGQVDGVDDSGCRLCVAGERCDGDEDCDTEVCDLSDPTEDGRGVCMAADPCSNGVRDNGETGTDCGALEGETSGCEACGLEQGCDSDDDCLSMRCDLTSLDGEALGECAPDPVCENEEQDTDETDVDCGRVGSEAPTCPLCELDQGCDDDSDCTSSYCDLTSNECKTPSCDDEVANGDEEGPDCGGSCDACECVGVESVGDGCGGPGVVGDSFPGEVQCDPWTDRVSYPGTCTEEFVCSVGSIRFDEPASANGRTCIVGVCDGGSSTDHGFCEPVVPIVFDPGDTIPDEQAGVALVADPESETFLVGAPVDPAHTRMLGAGVGVAAWFETPTGFRGTSFPEEPPPPPPPPPPYMPAWDISDFSFDEYNGVSIALMELDGDYVAISGGAGRALDDTFTIDLPVVTVSYGMDMTIAGGMAMAGPDTQTLRPEPGDRVFSGNFGLTLASHGDLFVMGAPADGAGARSQIAVYQVTPQPMPGASLMFEQRKIIDRSLGFGAAVGMDADYIYVVDPIDAKFAVYHYDLALGSLSFEGDAEAMELDPVGDEILWENAARLDPTGNMLPSISVATDHGTPGDVAVGGGGQIRFYSISPGGVPSPNGENLRYDAISLTSSGIEPTQAFGTSIALRVGPADTDGDGIPDKFLFVGDPKADDDDGAVFVFQSIEGTDQWRHLSTIPLPDVPASLYDPSEPRPKAFFGRSLALTRDHLIIGGPGVDVIAWLPLN